MSFGVRMKVFVAVATSLLLASCGGGSSAPTGSASCDLASQKDWLRGYMLDWYFWSGQSPNPEPAGYATLGDYFQALKFNHYAGVPNGIEPWSNYQDSASYNQFFAEGRSTGYGFAVNGLEGQLPLKVRYVEPQSPAGAQLVRGDVIKAINGVPDSTLIQQFAASDTAVLSGAAGEQITLDIERAGAPRRVTLTAAEYTLTPVPASATLSAGTATVGYVALKDFITQAEAELTSRLGAIRADGATDLIVDLRYNGGGRISTANHFASQIVGALHGGKVFTTLNYNAAHQSSNNSFTLSTAPAPAFGRVVVLTGPRSCSASELLVNGLRPYAQQVVTIGGTSCGKPYGFNPVASCENTFSIVNFRAVNAEGVADYDAGITPTCAVAEDFSGVFGDPSEKLTAAALSYLQTGSCPVAAAPSERATTLDARRRSFMLEPGERRGMTAD
ncbi:S41 family peptidase [uncultured Piscinibacter sp.]|uniref:S41 family peptidase n=1 Tax=uncultured Piscinibacter sp. TaxID=1131835 RepID=UPI002633A999|nr:S41 family peptidase [uncultured Piscinibacter sp.]